MARKRGFDTDAVLDAAMGEFWRRGYVATSLSDLYAATGLKPGSLYAAFSDKETLFQRAFERYAARFRATLPTDVEGLAAIQRWLTTQVELSASDPERKGCFIVNTASERGAHSETTRGLLRDRLQEIRDFFVRHLGIAAQRGELSRGVQIDVQADALLGVVISVMTLGRAGADRRTLEHVAAAALAPLSAGAKDARTDNS